MNSEQHSPRILVITIGQSPRPDLVSDLVAGLGIPASVSEIGLLDDISKADLDALRASKDEKSIIARLADGAWLVLSHKKISQLAWTRLEAVSYGAYDLVVLMSTGIFRDFESPCPTVNLQRAVEAATISLAAEGDKIGIIFPIERQVHELEPPAFTIFDTCFSHATHGDESELQQAAEGLKHCAYIVLSSAGYCEADRQLVAEVTGKPVILPRRIVGNSIRLILSSVAKLSSQEPVSDLQARVETLTARERQVMSLVCEGLSNKAIARQLDISYKTVEIHRSNVMKKMEAPSSGALIRSMVKAGFA